MCGRQPPRRRTRVRRVTEIEAQRLEETREEREAFLAALKEEIHAQSARKGVTLQLPGDPEPPAAPS